MNQILLALGIFLSGGLVAFTSSKMHGEIKIFKKTMGRKEFFLRALGVLLFLLYIPYLFSLEIIRWQIGLVGGVQSAEVTVLLAILKWFTYFSLAVCMIAPFYKMRFLKDYVAFIIPPIFLLNAIFLKPITVYITGSVNFYDYRIIIYSACLCLAGGMALSTLLSVIKEQGKTDLLKRVGKAFGFMGIYLMAFMPMYLPQLFFGHVGDTPVDFTLTHRILIYICFALMFGGFVMLRKKPYEEKSFFVIFLALSGFLQYFSTAHGTGIGSLPLHLCNTAIVLMLFAYVFKWNAVYYFTYMVNVLGAFLAIFMPNTAESVITMEGTIAFWYNHTYAAVLPIFGVAFGLFPRPNIKLMYKCMAAFTVYVAFAAFMNGWLNNSPSLNPGGAIEIDYFFLYSSFMVNKLPFAIPLKNFIWTFPMGDTMVKIYWVFVLGVWVVYVAMMFLIWGVYSILYRTADAHVELALRAKLMKVDKVQLLKELDGRPKSEPLHPEGRKMIKFNNFSKTYAGTDRKAVDNLNLEIKEGEVFGFIGHNGAGKSTTIKSLVGIQSITEGSIEVQGYDVARQPLEAKLSMGYVSDNHAVYENLTGREYISYVADLYMVSEKDKNERIEKYAKMFHLEKALDSEIKCYSHGMKQKTMVIGALIHNPKVWVLDEPLTGLDPTSSWQIKECMREHADQGNIVFFSSHVIEVVEKVCDRIAIIAGGKLCRVATIEEIKKEGISLEELYLRYAQTTTKEDMDGERV